ncbi:MAG: imidazole glycerol phosphate synthase subunit HisH [Hyphomonadaceae bacterium]|nr:imidazole glycerol phosphate synthase subunit HisH [Hyphomonadaceae bacterium]
MQTVALIDYGSGNVRSVGRALAEAARRAGLDCDVRLTRDPDFVVGADRIVLPGQGAFAACMDALTADAPLLAAMTEAVRTRAAPFLGVCVGMQLLMSEGLEHGAHPGLGWIPGVCRRHEGAERLPHMGWNAVTPVRQHRVLDGLAPTRHMVFMHSFVVAPSDAAAVATVTDYGAPFASAVARDNMVGVQFHPEKSQAAGLDLLARFMAWSPS